MIVASSNYLFTNWLVKRYATNMHSRENIVFRGNQAYKELHSMLCGNNRLQTQEDV